MPYVKNESLPILPWDGKKPGEIEPGTAVRVTPYYKVPSGRSSLTTVHTDFTVAAIVDRPFGDDAVFVKWHGDVLSGSPWLVLGDEWFKPNELHDFCCQCPRCKGEEIWVEAEER
ncbi:MULTISPECIES: hypothetical protein [unclassified Kitasatospora]|uniref:hypothetical protein n=1 Tax=unclassified Kitasatospora TaxID=2633591 RepID=UPI0037F955B8